jgi:hypothetical protein
MGGGEKLHWTAELGWLAIFVAVAVSIVVFILPVFEGGRVVAVEAVILPLVVIGGLLILFKRNPGQAEDPRGERPLADVNAGAVTTTEIATAEIATSARDDAVTDAGKTARAKGMSAKKKKESTKKGSAGL